MWNLEHLKEYHWEDAIARASCPNCNDRLNWNIVYPNGDLGLVELKAECCNHWWKLAPSIGWVESDYKPYLERLNDEQKKNDS